MGGASSFISMLCIAGFLAAAWIASKASKMAGISSIVLEITTGVVLGPRGLGLVDPTYTVCEVKRVYDCSEDGLQELIDAGKPLGSTFGRIVGKGLCHKSDYEHHDDHHGDSHGSKFDISIDYIGGVAGNSSTDDSHSDSHGMDAHGTDAHGMDAHGTDAHGMDAHGTDAHSAGHRRLAGGGNYHSFKECLVKSCEHEVSAGCGAFPDFFTLIGHAGVGLMIFESGMHFDFEKAKVVGPPACCVAVLGTILPLIAGTALVVAYGRPFMPDGVSAGTALAPTSVGIALRLLGEAGVLQHDFGQAIITAAFVDDILSLILFNVLFSLGGDFDMFKTVFAPIIGITLMIIACILAVKFWPWFLKDYVLAKVPKKKEENPKIQSDDEALFFVMFGLLFIYATITHYLGTHLWGCFIAGMSFACLEPPHHAHHVWVKQTKRITSWMIRIFFAGTVAFSIPVGQLLSLDAFWKGSIMGIVACIGTKVLCAPFMGKPRFVIGWAMVGRAEFAYLIAQMALAAGMMDAGTFSIVIWALLYATIFAPFVFRYLLNKYVASEGLGQEKNVDNDHFANPEASPAHDESQNGFDFDYNKKDFEAGQNFTDLTAAMKDATEYGQKSPGGELRAESGLAGHKENEKPGFLCCLFFKKVVVH